VVVTISVPASGFGVEIGIGAGGAAATFAFSEPLDRFSVVAALAFAALSAGVGAFGSSSVSCGVSGRGGGFSGGGSAGGAGIGSRSAALGGSDFSGGGGLGESNGSSGGGLGAAFFSGCGCSSGFIPSASKIGASGRPAWFQSLGLAEAMVAASSSSAASRIRIITAWPFQVPGPIGP
jgi:hypothetical protein